MVKLAEQRTTGTETDNIDHQIDECKREMDNLISPQTQRSALRSKTKYYEEGARGSRYFHNLENRNFTNKTIYSKLTQVVQQVTPKRFYRRVKVSLPSCMSLK